LEGTENLRVPANRRPPGKETQVTGIGHTGRRHVSQILCKCCRASAHQRTAHGMRGSGVIFHEFGQGPLPDITKRNPLAYLEVAKRIHMMAFRMHPVTSQNLIIISHIKKIHIRSSGGERILFCPECGCSVKIEDQFCESCGTALSKTGIPVPPQPYMPPPPEQAPPLTPVIPAPPQAYVPPPPQAYFPPPPEPTPPLTPVTTPLPGQPLPVRYKSAGLAALGSICFSGLGQVYNGQLRKGVAIFFGTIVGLLLFVVPGIIIWIFGVADAWQTAKKMNEGKIPFQEHSWRQIISFFIYSFVVGYLVYSLLIVLVGMINEGFFSDMMMS